MFDGSYENYFSCQFNSIILKSLGLNKLISDFFKIDFWTNGGRENECIGDRIEIRNQ